jgi:methionyl-tRNA formyltransferase
MLKKEDGALNWQLPASALARQVRAYDPWPGTYTHWKGKLLKILKAQARAVEISVDIPPGTVKLQEEAGHQVLAIVTGSGLLLVKQLQLEGKKAMSTEEFLHGYGQIVGQVLG